MSLDTTLVGMTAARLMEELPDYTAGSLVAVGIVAVVDGGDDGSYVRIAVSSDHYHERIGVFLAALDLVRGVGVAEGGGEP